VSGNRWTELSDTPAGLDYARRIAKLAASGVDMHGEATFCSARTPPGSRVLDAGCGTGRVAIRLAELGYDCLGVDSDDSMLEQARAAAPTLHWITADLAALNGHPELDGPFGLVVAAGNVIPLLAPGTEAGVVAALARRLVPAGLLISGFGLDAAHLPLPEAPFGVAEYDAWCVAAGLEPVARYATWDGEPFDDEGYAVSVHALPA